MRLNHVSHIAYCDQIFGVSNRNRSQVNTTFVDVAIGPKFCARNLTAQLLNYQHSDLAYSLDLSVAVATPVGRVVKKKALNEKLAGSWLEAEVKSGQAFVSDEWAKPETIDRDRGITELDLIVNDSVTRFDYVA